MIRNALAMLVLAFLPGCVWGIEPKSPDRFTPGEWDVDFRFDPEGCWEPLHLLDLFSFEYLLSGSEGAFVFETDDLDGLGLAWLLPPLAGSQEADRLVGSGQAGVVLTADCELGITLALDGSPGSRRMQGTMTWTIDAERPGTTSCASLAGTLLHPDYGPPFPTLSNATNGSCTASASYDASRDAAVTWIPPIYVP